MYVSLFGHLVLRYEGPLIGPQYLPDVRLDLTGKNILEYVLKAKSVPKRLWHTMDTVRGPVSNTQERRFTGIIWLGDYLTPTVCLMI
jgi:hypothetical protein